ncbi:transcriptional regulator GutM [Brevibacillus sp. WF146]|uniref:transcriptional regulator GutM n=1 Tax=Brevibacillus sp. WF146 TaxID=319501 RepID=UPI0007FC1210|nr:transcriptional regulator GutM [Brevibacillus sp. WF146]UYZ12257.1 transcriptional regulator GutM [Brevibacillus sp. WF146]
MASWGFFILLFVCMWVLQILLAAAQARHYREQLRELQRHERGFLGVGVSRRRFGAGAVVIVVTDERGVVTHCRKMAGISVFSRFRTFLEPVGRPIGEVLAHASREPGDSVQAALALAVEQIRAEQEKQRQKQQEHIG